MLRCFNDGVAALCLWAALFCFQRRQWSLGMLAYAWGLGTKMSLLLSLPAVGVVLLLGRGFRGALRLGVVLVQVQFALAVPFLAANPRGYLGRAFELSRQFLFRWTVNWRFVGEDVFLSRPFALGLLAAHAALLVLFAATRWLRPAAKGPLPSASSSLASAVALATPILARFSSPFSDAEEALLAERAATPRYVLTTILSANAVGLLTARSLHYQFYAYGAWATPYLLWRSGVHPVVQYALWAAQEWAWNVFPSTPASSGVVVAVLATTVALTWWGATDEFQPVLPAAKAEADKR